tara:strand:- start:9421 stop:10296 length:876 start_codon:yes stop_codon:yes gene_type:complete
MEWIKFFFFYLLISNFVFSQNSLESLLSPMNDDDEIVLATFFSTRIINSHSVELYDPGAMDMRISHRFGALNTGFYELFGLDQATIRLGFEYGLTKNMMIGIGRSSYKKNYDSFIKYSIIKQRKKQKIPISIVYFTSLSIQSIKKQQENYPFSGRLSYCNQLLISSKINKNFSLQIMPTYVHKNMVDFTSYFNDIILIGSAIKYNIFRSTSLNFEYFYRITDADFSNQSQDAFYNSFSIGLDIDAGGHVFQLHVTNSLSMYEVGFLTETNRSWFDGGIHFGFNISREFTLK